MVNPKQIEPTQPRADWFEAATLAGRQLGDQETLHVVVSWAGLCEFEVLPKDGPFVDTYTAPCDEQPFTSTISCGEAPCEVRPTALTNTYEVRLRGAGSLTLSATLRHSKTGEEQTIELGSAQIVQPTALRFACTWAPNEAEAIGPVDCASLPALHPPASLKVLVLGEVAGGATLIITPEVSAEVTGGVEDLAGARQAAGYERWIEVTAAGTAQLTAKYDALEATLTLAFE